VVNGSASVCGCATRAAVTTIGSSTVSRVDCAWTEDATVREIETMDDKNSGRVLSRGTGAMDEDMDEDPAKEYPASFPASEINQEYRPFLANGAMLPPVLAGIRACKSNRVTFPCVLHSGVWTRLV
jgi:hypothetical protein